MDRRRRDDRRSIRRPPAGDSVGGQIGPRGANQLRRSARSLPCRNGRWWLEHKRRALSRPAPPRPPGNDRLPPPPSNTTAERDRAAAIPRRPTDPPPFLAPSQGDSFEPVLRKAIDHSKA